MFIFTGDIHAEPRRLSKLNKFNLTRNDYVIILGDFGLIWHKEENKTEKYWLDWLNNKPWTTLFIEGNHENYDRLESYPWEKWNGGNIQRIRPNVIHLGYGNVFTINGKKLVNLGGARSHDIQHGIIDPDDYMDDDEMRAACRNLELKHGGWQFTMYRIKGISWWEQEVPDECDREFALDNLDKCNNEVNYILSHEGPASDVAFLGGGQYKPDEYSKWLENIRQNISYDKWLFGHYHLDKIVNDKEQVLYEGFVMLD